MDFRMSFKYNKTHIKFYSGSTFLTRSNLPGKNISTDPRLWGVPSLSRQPNSNVIKLFTYEQKKSLQIQRYAYKQG